jgi:hypothetical protein
LYPEDAANNDQAKLWLPQAFDYINVTLGPQYQRLVVVWIALERSSHWQSSRQNRLSPKKRPELLGKWVDGRRYLNKASEPDINNDCGRDFAKGVRTWWESLKPTWRLKQGFAVPPSEEQDWKELNKYGVNGWYGIIVCLKWIGTNLQNRRGGSVENLMDKETQEWLDLVEDVLSTMKALTGYRTILCNNILA